MATAGWESVGQLPVIGGAVSAEPLQAAIHQTGARTSHDVALPFGWCINHLICFSSDDFVVSGEECISLMIAVAVMTVFRQALSASVSLFGH